MNGMASLYYRCRSFLTTMLLIVVFAFAYANDSSVEVSGGSLGVVELGQNADVQMVAEQIHITLFDGYYQTEVQFQFYNHGPTQTVLVGFPQWVEGTTEIEEFFDFAAELNGRTAEYAETELSEPLPIGLGMAITKWFLREVTFPEESWTTTSVSYKTPYRDYGRGADYLFGTGSTWKGPIGRMQITVENKTDMWINRIHYGTYREYRDFQNVGGIIHAELTDVLPEISNTIYIETSNVPSALYSIMRINPDRYWSYAQQIISQNELEYLSEDQLEILKNVILARHGHIPDSQHISDWLLRYCADWYTPTRTVSPQELTGMELENYRLILAEERSR